jgi:prepilin-type N-terminal cleavage/methylation domain-containing protein
MVMIMRSNRSGFTLVELLVVIGVIAMLVAIAMPAFKSVRIKARETEIQKNLDTIRKALEQFAVDYNGMYPYRVHAYTANGSEILSTDLTTYYPLGIWGGVPVANQDGSLNTQYATTTFVEPQWSQEHMGLFNQLTDPLRTLGYLDAYPNNPFMKRPMGAIVWAFDVNDRTIPHPRVNVCSGDFVYTYNMGVPEDTGGNAGSANADREDPSSVISEAISYQVLNYSSLPIADGEYRIDVVDNYQLWAYGQLDTNGPFWAVYPNSAIAAPTRPKEPKRDFNENGIRDEFERGLVGYFSGGRKFYEDTTSTGDKYEF